MKKVILNEIRFVDAVLYQKDDEVMVDDSLANSWIKTGSARPIEKASQKTTTKKAKTNEQHSRKNQEPPPEDQGLGD